MRRVIASELRRDVCRLLDEVSDAVASKTAAVRGNPHALTGDPDDIVHMDWSPSWDRQE